MRKVGPIWAHAGGKSTSWIDGGLAYLVSQRAREIGIRIAMGAGKSAILRISLLLTAFVASLLPARRAALVDPVETLRSE